MFAVCCQCFLLRPKALFVCRVSTSRPSLTSSDAFKVLESAAIFENVSRDEVSLAFTAFEEEVSANVSEVPDLGSVAGKWRLVFSSLIPFGYFPITEICDFYGFTLASSLGPIPLGTIEGDSRVVGLNPAEIAFKNRNIRFGAIRFPLKTNKPERSYTFLFVGDEFMVAKSSSGGYTLLRKVN